MRLVPFLALSAVAMTAIAPTAMAADRYGPPPVRRAGPAAAMPQPQGPTPISYQGRILAWPGKVAAAPSVALQPPQPPPAPQRLATGLYRGGPGSAPPPAPAAPTPPTAPLPDSLYAPAPAAAAPSPTLPPPPSPTRLAASPYASSAPRSYSVIREYGGTPDPIAAPKGAGSMAFRPETSLVTPLDDPKPKPKGRTADASDPDWGAADDPGLSQGAP